MGLPPLHWLGTTWWCFGQDVVVLLLLAFSSFFPTYAILTANVWPCLVLAALSLPVLNFYGKCHGFIGLCPTFAPSWARESTYCYFRPGRPIGPYFFLFFVSGFYIPLFLSLLTNFLLHSFFTCYWAFLLLGIFLYIKKGHQQR